MHELLVLAMFLLVLAVVLIMLGAALGVDIRLHGSYSAALPC
jgi:small basic protein